MGQPIDNSKAVLYGQFILAAYDMFDRPQGGDPLRPEPSSLIPADYELGAWIQMSDFVLDIVEHKFYGIVCHEVKNPDSRIVAIRGTEHAIEWIDDGLAIPVPFRQVPSAGRVAYGFDKIYSSMKVVKRRLTAADTTPETFSGSFADQLDQEATSRERERGFAPPPEGMPRRQRPTIVTGHSLGGALATLFVMENHNKCKFDVGMLCTFASPRVGNTEFVNTFNQVPVNSWRIVNQRDVVPKLPFQLPAPFDFGHIDTAYSFDSFAFAKKSLECRHAMQTYLHWLDSSTKLLPQCV